MKFYQYCEGGITYLLGVDHDKKFYSLGSFQGKPQKNTKFVEIDQTAYADHIQRINRTYQCIDNSLCVEKTDKK